MIQQCTARTQGAAPLVPPQLPPRPRPVMREVDATSSLASPLSILLCSFREYLEGRKIQGLTFRLMPEEVLIRTLSFGSEDDEWLNVCKDWLEALSPSSGLDEPGSQE